MLCGPMPNIVEVACIHQYSPIKIDSMVKSTIEQWEIKRIETPHIYLSTVIQDHVNLDSHQIASIVVNSVRTNPSIPMKNLVA